MFKVFFLTIIVGITIWTTQANNTNESECRGDIERELSEYVKLESWQELFREHFKFVVNKNGEILSEKNRLKFNTIIHNAIYGCDHNRDDEVDDCPFIFKGSIKTCKLGLNLRAAMFRTARCSFVKSSVKHLVLTDAILDVYPLDQLDRLTVDVDRPVREFGENVVNMLSTLAHGEQGGLSELIALNLYLNNKYDTVFLYKIPAEPITSSDDFVVAKEHMRQVHRMILDKLYAFWDTWCSDSNVVAQYQYKYKNAAFKLLMSEMYKNTRDTENLVRSLNVSDNVVDLDFDPKRIALTDFVNHMISNRSMPAEFLADMQLKLFQTSYEFNPRTVVEYQMSVFRPIFTCFYWMTITHLKLGVRLIDNIEQRGIEDYHRVTFIANFVRFTRPLMVFDLNRLHFVSPMSPAAATNLSRLIAFLLQIYRNSRDTHSSNGISSLKPVILKFVDLLSTDMENMLQMTVPDSYFDDLNYENTLKLMQSNHQAFARLVSSTCRFKEDQMNAAKLKKFMLFLSEAVEFQEI